MYVARTAMVRSHPKSVASIVVLLLTATACGGTAVSPNASNAIPTGTDATASAGTDATASADAPVESGVPIGAVEGGEPGGVLTWKWDSEPPHLDAHLSPFSATAQVSSLVHPRLNRFNEKGELSPDLARTWEVSPEGDVITYHLFEGVHYPDEPPLNGREVTADDVVFNLERLRSPESAASSQMERVKSIEAVDPYTVRIELSEPYTPFLYELSREPYYIYPPEMVEKYGSMEEAEAHSISAGAYRLVEWDKGVGFTFEKNPDYFWADRVYIDRIEGVFISEHASGVAALRTGQIHGSVEFTSKSELDAFVSESPGINVHEYERPCANHLWLQSNSEKLQDIRVRQAIGYAINNEAILQTIFEGNGSLCGPLPNEPGWALSPEEIRELFPYDPDKARQLLADAGYEDGLELSVTYVPDFHTEQVELYTSMLADVGITLDTQTQAMDQAAWLERVYTEHDYPDLAIAAATLADIYQQIEYSYRAGGVRNLNNLDDPQVNEWIDELVATTDVARQQELAKQVQRRLATELLWSFVQPSHFRWVTWSEEVNNWTFNNDGDRAIYDLGGLRWAWLSGE